MQAAIGLQDGLLIPSVLSSLPIMAWLTDYFRRNENNEQSSLTNGVQTDRAILQLEEELDRMHELLLMTAGLNATLNVERVLEMTLDLANRA
ncbi:MAG: hypothetical protein PVG04_07545, partial [Anaerolineales bacterium]